MLDLPNGHIDDRAINGWHTASNIDFSGWYPGLDLECAAYGLLAFVSREDGAYVGRLLGLVPNPARMCILGHLHVPRASGIWRDAAGAVSVVRTSLQRQGL